MPIPKGFLFDFDGVIVDSFESHYSAWSSAFKEIFDADIAPFPESCIGKTPMIIANYFCSVIGQEDKTEDLYFLKDKHILTNFTVPKLLPGVHEFTNYLTKENVPYRYCE